VTAAGGRTEEHDVAPSLEDPVVAGASNLIGGPVGRRAIPGRRVWVLLALVGFVLVTCGLAWAQKLPCRDPANWKDNYQYTHLCYSDVVALYYSEKLVGDFDPNTGTGDRIKVPYVDHDVEYPPIIGGLMWLAAEGTNVSHPDDPHLRLNAKGETEVVDNRPETFFDLTALILAAAAVVVVIATSATHRRRPWDAALFALAPALVFHAFTNWDLAAAAFAALALLAWSRKSPWLAGLFLGLGVTTKLYPVLFLVPLFALCLRTRRLTAWAKTAVAMGATVLLVYVPLLLVTPVYADGQNGERVQVAPSAWSVLHHGGGWSDVRQSLAGLPIIGQSVNGDSCAHNGVLRFFDLNRTRGADYDSIWYAVNQWTGHPKVASTGQCAAPTHLNWGVTIAVLLVMIGLVILTLMAARRPRLPQLLFLGLAGFLLVNKVYSPQYVIWLLPLAALARPRWRAFLVWQATEIGLLAARYIFFVGLSAKGGGISFGWFEAAVLLRDGALIYLMACVVYEILRPHHDVVRRDGSDDPAGGVLDEAPDRGQRSVPSQTPAVSVPA
jgi:uncharacterized membrane protein